MSTSIVDVRKRPDAAAQLVTLKQFVVSKRPGGWLSFPVRHSISHFRVDVCP